MSSAQFRANTTIRRAALACLAQTYRFLGYTTLG